MTGAVMTDGSGIRTEKTDAGDPEGMTLYAELSFYLGDTEWRLQKFAQSDLVDHGELLLDDRCRFLIRAVSGMVLTYFLMRLCSWENRRRMCGRIRRTGSMW